MDLLSFAAETGSIADWIDPPPPKKVRHATTKGALRSVGVGADQARASENNI